MVPPRVLHLPSVIDDGECQSVQALRLGADGMLKTPPAAGSSEIQLELSSRRRS